MILHAVKLSEGEEVLQVIRRHWFHIAVTAAIDIFIFIAVAFGVLAATNTVSPDFLLGKSILPLGIYILAFVGILLWMQFFAVWSDHWLDAWIITNKRIVDIEQHGFFRRQVSSFPLDRIQDVTFSINGIIAMWLHFGNVRIQTASISDDLIMKQVPFPEDVKEAIVQVLDREKNN